MRPPRYQRCYLLCFLVLTTSAIGKPVDRFDWPTEIDWQPKFIGIDYANLELSKPRRMQLHALRIDLKAKGIAFCTNEDNGELPEETHGLLTSSFLIKKKCQVAINGAPFWPGRAEENLGQNIVGLTISEGKLISPLDQDKPRSALVFRDGLASIETPPIDLKGVDTAVGGFGVVLHDRKLFRDTLTPLDVLDGMHPRTAIAIANEGTTLYLLVIDGRQPGYSEGVTLAELGKLLQLIGAVDGLNMDGGGSSTMVLSTSNQVSNGVLSNTKNELLPLQTQPMVVNQPINGGVVGAERVSASHLGIYALPLLAKETKATEPTNE